MRKIPHSIEEETWEEQRAARRHNPGLVMITGRAHHRTLLFCGRHDEIDVRKIEDHLYVLARNHHLGYIGLEVFRLRPDGEPIPQGDMFLQSDEDVDGIVGKGGIDRSVPYIIKSMAQYVQ